MLFRQLASLLALLGAAAAEPSKAFDGGDDLLSFVTEPELRPPRWDITTFDASKSKPGYWFIAPYAKLDGQNPAGPLEFCQIGPQIYDNSGDLVWSGACRYENRNAYDLKVVEYNGKPHLSMILNGRGNDRDRDGVGAILDETYTTVKDVVPQPGIRDFNMHGWNVIEGGKTALLIAGAEPKIIDVSFMFDPKPERPRMSQVFDNGFQEYDLEKDKVVYDWRSLDNIDFDEVRWGSPDQMATVGKPWDWFHLNQVVKTRSGDFIISARHTNTIYRISRKTGKVMWRLEGMGSGRSDFTLDGFNFSRQHDAQIMSEGGDKMVISFLDNAADGGPSKSREVSAGYFVELDQKAMTAKLLKEFKRPGGGFSDMRGNMQVLPNGNVFLCWSKVGHISEFDSDGNLVLNASWTKKRFVTYRAFKFDWVGKPAEKMKVKAFVFGPSLKGPMTFVAYVSWNGATEVAKYRFYERDQLSGANVIIGVANRTGFETKFMAAGAQRQVFVQALDKDGEVLGESDIVETEWPSTWTDSAEDQGQDQDQDQDQDQGQNQIQPPSSTPSQPLSSGGRFSPEELTRKLSELTREHRAAYGTGAAIGFFVLGIVSTLLFGRCCRRRRSNRAGGEKPFYKVLPDPDSFDAIDRDYEADR